jgi:DNA-binding GntR family transcriptional regulator
MTAAITASPEGQTTVSLEPVARNFSLTEHVYGELRQAILDARIYDAATDLRLDERTLADQLGISRTPVREALARLAQEGLVEIQPRKGVFILRKTRDEILEMITVWAALESMAARLATERASDTEIASLRRLASGFRTSDARAHIDDYSESNITFHQRILELAKCPMLKDIADGLFVHVRAVRSRAMHESDRVTRSLADHMQIVEAIEARDGDLASTRVREHTMGLHDHVRRTWRDFHGT